MNGSGATTDHAAAVPTIGERITVGDTIDQAPVIEDSAVDFAGVGAAIVQEAVSITADVALSSVEATTLH